MHNGNEGLGSLWTHFRLPRPDRAPIYDWAKRHVTLPDAYATPGPFNVKLSPWLIGVFDALQNPLIRRVHFRKAVQTGGTLIADIWVSWLIANDPGPISWTMPTDETAERHCKSRLMPLLERCAPVSRMLPRLGPLRTTTEIYLGGSFFVCNSANITSQQSQSIRFKINDELFLPRWQDVYGHAIARVSKFEEVGRSKILNISQAPILDAETGNVEDVSFRAGNQQEWSAECRACRGIYPLAFSHRSATTNPTVETDSLPRAGVIWDHAAKRDDKTWDTARAVETVRFKCPHCGDEMPDSDPTREHWRKTGRYVPTRLDAPPETVSFHVEALVSRPMRMLVEQFCEAENHAVRNGDDTQRMEFRTKREAKPWLVEKRTVNIFIGSSGYKVADYADGKRIDDETGRFMMIDRQLNHWWAEVGAFSGATGPRYRQLWFGRVDTRDQLREIQRRYGVANSCVAQDRKYRPSDVDRDCAEFGWRGMMGHARKTWTMRDDNSGQLVNFPFSDPRTTQYQGADVFFYDWSGDYFKDILAAALERRGELKWELPDDVNPLYLEHLRGEAKKEVRPGVWEWREVKSNAPNHGLDDSAMMLCVATIAGLIRYVQPTTTALTNHKTHAHP